MEDDITESEITALARTMKEAEMPSSSELRRLRSLKVTLPDEVLPQHQIETRAGSRPPTKEELQQFEAIIPVKKGVYSPQEDETIVNNWAKFCKLHDWKRRDVAPFLQLRTSPDRTFIRSKRERRKFAQFLASGLPDRTLYSVYHRFKNLFEENLQSRYTPEEDRTILEHIENNPNLDEKRKYADLAKVLKRTRHSIWRRYKLLKKKRQKLLDE